MPEGSGPADPEPSEVESTSGERLRPLATRRDFLVGAGAGAVAVGVVAGAGIAVTRGNTQPAPALQTGPGGPAVAVPPAPAAQPAAQPAQPAQAAQPAQPAPAQLPPTMRRVSMDIDGVKHDVT